MKKRLALAMAGIMCVTALAGCGKVSSEADADSNKAPAKKLFSKEISLAEAFSPESEYKIWYRADIDGGSGSGSIGRVYVFNGNELKYYKTDINIKDIKDMTDEEVIKLMEEKYVPKTYNDENKEYLAELEQNLPKYRNAIDEILKIETPSEKWSNDEWPDEDDYPTVSELKSLVRPFLDAINNFDIKQYKTDNEIKYNYEIKTYWENNSTLTEELEDVVTSEHINVSNNDYEYTDGEIIKTLAFFGKILDEYNTGMSNAEDEKDRKRARWYLFNDLREVLYEKYEKDALSHIEKRLESDNAFVTVSPDERVVSTVVKNPFSECIKIGDTYFGGYVGTDGDLVCRCKEGTVFTMDKVGAPGTVKSEEYKEEENTEENTEN